MDKLSASKVSGHPEDGQIFLEIHGKFTKALKLYRETSFQDSHFLISG